MTLLRKITVSAVLILAVYRASVLGAPSSLDESINEEDVEEMLEELIEDISEPPDWEYGGEAHEDLKAFKVMGEKSHTKAAVEKTGSNKVQNPHQTNDEERIELQEEKCEFYEYQKHLAEKKGIDVNSIPVPENCQESKKRKRKKRLAVTGVKYWTNAVIPYVWSSTTSTDREMMGRLRAHNHYHYWTCVRFVENTPTTKADYNLDHDNYLIHKRGKGCHSSSGNRKKSGQSINCCRDNVCVHELGHVLGMAHEQKNPLRGDYTRANLDNIHGSEYTILYHMYY